MNFGGSGGRARFGGGAGGGPPASDSDVPGWDQLRLCRTGYDGGSRRKYWDDLGVDFSGSVAVTCWC